MAQLPFANYICMPGLTDSELSGKFMKQFRLDRESSWSANRHSDNFLKRKLISRQIHVPFSLQFLQTTQQRKLCCADLVLGFHDVVRSISINFKLPECLSSMSVLKQGIRELEACADL